MSRLSEIGGRRLPFLRWSVWRFVFGARSLLTNWQVGDGREEALARHVIAHARPGDLDDAIRAVDDFCYRQSIMMNVGDEKGEILDRAIARAKPRRLLELGTYCGYSALRSARAMPPGAHLTSIEFSAANAEIARRIWEHAGVRGPDHRGGRLARRRREDDRAPRSRARLRARLARLRVRRPRQGRPTCPISSGSSHTAGCTPGRWSSRTTSGSRGRRSIAPT
jgi:hypothetical protein